MKFPSPEKLKKRRTLRGPFGKICDIIWSPLDPTLLISVSQDAKLILWNGMTNLKKLSVTLPNKWVMCCGYSPTGKECASAGIDGICSVFKLDVEPPVIIKQLRGHTSYISACSFIHEDAIITCSGDYSSVLWDIEKESKIIQFTEHIGDITSLCLNKDKNTFVTGSIDTTIKLWDIRVKESVSTFVAHGSDVNVVKFFPNGLAFGSGSDDHTARLWDIRAYRELMVYKTADTESSVTSLTFSKSGSYLFTGCDDPDIHCWITLQGELAYSMLEHVSRISSLALNSDGTALASASWDNCIKIWA